jgi:hypothetical protein
LRGSAWERWLLDAPDVEAFGDATVFAKAFQLWLDDKPGANAVPNEAEAAALIAWLRDYDADLLSAKIAEPRVSMGNLGYAFATAVAAIGAIILAVVVGSAAAGIASLVTGVVLAGFAYFLARDDFRAGVAAHRKDRIFAWARKSVRKLQKRYWP